MTTSLDELILPFFRSMGLERYLLDPEVSELMITNGLVFVERAGQIREIEGVTIDERKLRAGVEIIGQSYRRSDRRLSKALARFAFAGWIARSRYLSADLTSGRCVDHPQVPAALHHRGTP